MNADTIRDAVITALKTITGWSGDLVVRRGRYSKAPNRVPFVAVSRDGTETKEGRDFFRLTHVYQFKIQIWLAKDETDSGPQGDEDILTETENTVIDTVYSCFDSGGTLHGGTYLFDSFSTVFYHELRYLEITLTISE